MRFGEMTLADAELMGNVLEHYSKIPILRFLEIGTHRGGTARAVKTWCDNRGQKLDYWGIDNGALGVAEAPFEGAHFFLGNSAEVFHLIPHNMDIVFIDGDHGGNAVILDTIHYGKRVRVGGMLLFHDTSPHIQQTMREASGPDNPWWCNSVLAAHAVMGFPTHEWKLLFESNDPAAKIGGMQAYLKIV